MYRAVLSLICARERPDFVFEVSSGPDAYTALEHSGYSIFIFLLPLRLMLIYILNHINEVTGDPSY